MTTVGFSLGAFRLERQVGRGGTAIVWAGTQLAQGVPVAVKVVTEDLRRERALQAHLRGEVRAMAQLDHPSIVMVFDCGHVSLADEERSRGLVRAGNPYFAMELADRGTVSPLCGRAPWRTMRHVLLSLLDALAHAHARGVLHRDVKPSNVLLFGDGAVKLSDFGLARALDVDADIDEGRVGGTPAYMAPEQLQGAWRDLDCATDLYAVGCVAFALASGQPPYGAGADFGRMFRLHLHAAPPLTPAMPVPEGFDRWVRRLLHRNPARRFERAADAALALMALGEPAPARVGSSPPAASPSATPPSPGDLSTITSTHLAAPSVPCLESQPPHDSYLSLLPPAPLATAWEQPEARDHSMGLVSAGLGLYGLRAIRLIARRAERNRLWDELHAAANAKEPRVVVLEGPAGCGKSRLAQWLCERAHETGAATVLRAVHGRRTGPAHGLAAMMARALHTRGLPRERLHAHITSMLARQGVDDPEAAEVDALKELVAPASERERAGGDVRIGSALERHVLVERYVARLAEKRLVIVWLEDVQWSLEAIDFARHMLRASRARALLLLTARTETLGERGLERRELRLCLEHPRASRLEIGPLPEHDRPALVEDLLRLHPDVAARVTRRTEGNPLFAIQLVGDWVERRLLEPSAEGFRLRADASVELPDEIHQMWRDRVERFLATRPAGDAVSLELAAVLGPDVDGEEWRAVCAIAGVEARTELVEDFIARRLATTGPDGPAEGWAFSHGMLCESIERLCQQAGRLADHHRTCARMLSARVGPRRAARLGRHLLAAGDLHDALEPLRLGSRDYFDTGDYVASGRLLDEHRDAMRRLAIAADDPRWGQDLLLRCRLSMKRGAFEEALAHAAEVESHARVPGWGSLLVEALLLQGDIYGKCGELSLAATKLEQAEKGARAGRERRLLAECLEALGRVRLHGGERGQAEACWREAHAVSTELGDPLRAASALWEVAHALTYEGRHDEATAINESAHREFVRLGDRWAIGRSLNLRGEIARLRGELAAAETAYRQARLLMEALGADDGRAICDCNLARVLVERGRFREARSVLETSAATFASHGRRSPLAWVQTVLLSCLASEREWHEWDARMASVREILADNGYLDLDIAYAAQLAGGLARDAGEKARARVVYGLALSQWEALGRDEDSAAVRALLDDLD